MIKVLHILSSLSTGGIASMLHNYCKNIDSKFKFEFIIHGYNKGFLESAFEKIGDIHHVSPRKVNIIKNIIQTNKIIKNGKYDIVEIHQNQKSFLPLILSRIHGIEVRIVHFHGQNYQSQLPKFIKNMFIRLSINNSTTIFSCGITAYKSYANDIITTKNIPNLIVKNVIDVKKFKFDESIRNEVRQNLRIVDKFVVGIVARFSPEKNIDFAIDVFVKLKEKISNIFLLIVGEGAQKEEIEGKIENYSIADSVQLLGKRNDVNELLMSMDMLLLPSVYEGFGMVALEAQVSGLKCVVSTGVPNEVNVTKTVSFLSLDKGSHYWAKEIEKMIFNYERIDYSDQIRQQGYDSDNSSQTLKRIYMDLLEKKDK